MEINSTGVSVEGQDVPERPACDEVMRAVVAAELDSLVSAVRGDIPEEDPDCSLSYPLRTLNRLGPEHRAAATELVYDHARLTPADAVAGRDGVWRAWTEDSVEVTVRKLREVAEQFVAESRRLEQLRASAAAWGELTDLQRGQIISFFENAVVNGLAMAGTFLRPGFGVKLSAITSGVDVQLLYSRDVAALDEEEYWRLYGIAEQDMKTKRDARTCSNCSTVARDEAATK